ncbi:hypothetical protein [Thiocystis violacea]|uniref:hypothetical protein n=1 Tax=Thiocystis violacea TaxID=13725 RepID=UPI0019062336|nr:hypothetical protein [Thiocystis violacea]MBK1724317.1 hypothetical protein [Thiocystis violacea]
MARADGRISNKARGLLLAMALFLGLPALAMLWTDDAKRADWENHPLAPFPPPWDRAPESAGFFPALDDWIDDHFGLALPLNRLHRRMLFYGFRDSPSPQLSLGRDGFVYLNTHDARHPNAAFTRLCDTGPVNREYDRFAQAWLGILEHFQDAGLRTVLGIAPTKPVVYPDRLPNSVPRAIRAACLGYRQAPPPLRRLVEDAKTRGLRVVYPLDAFVAHRDDDNFYPRESFHFSGQSAQLFAQTLMREVGIDPQPIAIAPRYEGRIKADLQKILGFNRRIRSTQTDYGAFDTRVAYRQPDFVTTCYQRALDFGTYETGAPITERTALILSDSFGAFTAAHLAPAYRRLTWINVSDLRDEEGPGFLTDCLGRIPAQDLFFVFHDGGALWDGGRLQQTFLGTH